MALLHNAFTGKLNLDEQEYRVPEGDWVDALNITRDSRGDYKDVVVANIDGNQWVLYSLPPETNKCIGQYADKLRNRVYMFIWNSEDHDLILYYDRNLDTVFKLIENIVDTNGIDVLNFNPSYKILHTDIIYRDEEGDLLLWTDGLNAPREINVQTISSSYTAIKESFIELAKRPPLEGPTCEYGSDTTKNANNLRRTMFRFMVRWHYDDFSYSTFSTYSKVPLPVGFYGSDNDIDNTNNNFITITYPTGEENVAKVEIGFQYSLGTTWTDILTAVVLDKSDLNIPDNDHAQYLFYNDNVYPPIAVRESTQLFDWVPRTALTQALPNGNTPIYGAILEGYNNFPRRLLRVTITAENKTNTPPDGSGTPSLTYEQVGAATFFFTVGPFVPTGTHYVVYMFFNGTPPTQTHGPRLVGDYTSLPGDTASDVAFALYNQFNAYPSVPTIAASHAAESWQANLSTPGSSVFLIQVTAGSSPTDTISTEKTWLWDANYVFGIVYVDEQNRDMPGVTTFTNPTDSDNDFAVTTPSFSEDLGIPQTPVISASIDHLPPDGAKKYYWVRRRATYGDFIMYETADFQEEDGFYYFCLNNVTLYHDKNSQFIYSSNTGIELLSDTRIKIIAGINTDAYDGDVFNEDYLILGTEVRTYTAGSSPDNDYTYIKVKAPATPPSPAYTMSMLVMVYQPLKNPVTEDGAVYYEWGESYDIYTGDDGIRYHAGMDQNQTASQPATFTWEEGDVYYHERTMYRQLLSSPFGEDTVPVMDANFSDFFPSAVNDNGRPQVIEANALETFLPAIIRFGNSYQTDTVINQINRFYFDNFEEIDRSNGAIKKLFIEGRKLYCFQQFDIGVMPILSQVIENISGNPLQANSQTLLNKVMYPYEGKYGIGDVPASFVYGKGAKYGIDNNKGVAWRLSQDGLTPISVVYQCNNFFVTTTEQYAAAFNPGLPETGKPSIYGVFNEYNDHVIWAFEEIDRTYDDSSVTWTIENYLTIGKLVTFIGTATLGITINLRVSGPSVIPISVQYITQGGETAEELCEIFIDLINESVSFKAASYTADSFTITKVAFPFLPAPTVTITKSVPPSYFQEAKTITFNESRNQREKGFESFRSDKPEMYGCLNNLLYAFKNGQFWKYEGALYNNFFGEQFDSYITPIFNGSPGNKKTYEYVTLYASQAWSAPSIMTQLSAYNGQKQESYLVLQDFREKEGNFNAAFRRDVHSIGGIVNGAPLRGNYMSIKLFAYQPYYYVYLNGVVVSYIDSPKNPR